MSEQACKTSPQSKLAEMVSLMSRGARVLLDGIPDDPSFLSTSIGPESAKEIARAIQSLQAELREARNAALEEAAQSVLARASAVSKVCGADPQGQLEGAADDIRALKKEG